MKTAIDVDYIRACLRYDAGKLYWLKRPLCHFPHEHAWKSWNSRYCGKEAGSTFETRRDVRHKVRVDVKEYLRSRLVWILHHGVWPSRMLDHRNRNTLDDRIENLREATRSQNAANQGISKVNTSGRKGVSWNKRANKWRAAIKVHQKSVHLGLFINLDDASAAYEAAAKEVYGEFSCSGDVCTI